MDEGVFRLQHDACTIRGDGLLNPAQIMQRLAEIAVRHGIVRAERNGMAIHGLGFLAPPQPQHHGSEIDIRIDKIGPDGDGMKIGLDGFPRPALRGAEQAQAVAGHSMVGGRGYDRPVETFSIGAATGVVKVDGCGECVVNIRCS